MRKSLVLKIIGLAVLLVILAVILVVASRLTGSGSAAQNTASSAAAAASSARSAANTSSVPSAADSPASDTPAETDKSINTDETLTTVPTSKEEALSFAANYAAQYDYDRAVACLMSITGYESDADLQNAISDYTAQKAACVAVDVTSVPHVFFHSFMNDDRGLRADVVGQDRAMKNDTAMVTSDEFDHIISDLYNAGYVLVSLDDLCVKSENSDGSVSVAKNNNLLLPEGKKALVLSEDDLSYYHSYGEGTQGYATKMVLDENGDVKCEYTNESGETLVGDYDVAPRLNTFINEHPDFSYKGAHGTIALTGYNGVFGYRTNDYYKDINNPHLDRDQIEWLENHPDFNWDEDVANARKIADALKKEGWTFASHTYAHWNASTKSAEQLKEDNERWMTVNHDIVGDTDKIIFAFGGDISDATPYSESNEKYAYFKSQGYVIFCNVDGNIGWTQFGPTYLRTGRVALDGFTMYQAMTEDAASHTTYGHDYEVLGITDIASFFNPNRITPITSE